MENKTIISDIVELMLDVNHWFDNHTDRYGFHAEIDEKGKFSAYVVDRTRGEFTTLIEREVKFYENPEKALSALHEVHAYCLGYEHARERFAPVKEVDFTAEDEIKAQERRDQE